MKYATQELIDTLKKARRAKGLSQQVLAAKVSVPQSHISRIESGQVNLTLASFVEIARTLELDVMLVPRQMVALVKGFMQPKQTGENRPAYLPDEEDENE